MKNDPRYIAMYDGLNQLNDKQLSRLIDYPMSLFVLDDCNHDEKTGKYCPLAVALGIAGFYKAIHWTTMTNGYCQDLMRIVGGPDFVFNQLKETPGEFFRDNRRDDLACVLNDVLNKRGLTNG